MLTKRIIACLDVRNGRVVKGKKFDNILDVEDPAVLGAFYSKEGVDELIELMNNL
jgi:cyclase